MYYGSGDAQARVLLKIRNLCSSSLLFIGMKLLEVKKDGKGIYSSRTSAS